MTDRDDNLIASLISKAAAHVFMYRIVGESADKVFDQPPPAALLRALKKRHRFSNPPSSHATWESMW